MLLRSLLVCLALLAAPSIAQAADGVLILAHGAHTAHGKGHGKGHDHQASAANPWNDTVQELVRELDAWMPTEVAFGMADPETIQEAVDRLQARGVTRIAAVPLFVSSHSPIIGNFRYILGLQDQLAATTRLTHLDRISSQARFVFAGAMDDDPLVTEVLADRARATGVRPSSTHLVLIAHGPNDDGENARWLAALQVHARRLTALGFGSVTALTHRNDAPPEVKAKARNDLRDAVARGALGGDVVVLPVLLAKGGIETELAADLAHLPHRFAEPLMPHPAIVRWARQAAQKALAGS